MFVFDFLLLFLHVEPTGGSTSTVQVNFGLLGVGLLLVFDCKTVMYLHVFTHNAFF